MTCSGKRNREMIRKPAVAGMFYPSDSSALERMVRSFLSDSGKKPSNLNTGIVSPHAGYIYSGSVAGAAFASAPDKVRNVIIIAPTHRYPVRGASVFDGEGYSTPLGTVSINKEITRNLLEEGLVFQPAAHSNEHSAEVQVPFVQVRWPGSSIAVILQGTTSSAFSKELAASVAEATAGIEETLIVASSDLSHYHSIETAERKDRKIIEAFISGNPINLETAVHEGGEACGIGPVLTLMYYAERMKQRRFEEIMWDTSATASGDSGSVVGYFAGCCGWEAGQ
jgi:MEMO1 family protein